MAWVNKLVSFTVSLRRRERVVEMSEEDLTKLLVRVDIPDLKTQVCCILQCYPDSTSIDFIATVVLCMSS